MIARTLQRFTTGRTNAPGPQFWIYFSAAIFFNLGFSIFFFLFNLYLLALGFNEKSLGLIGSAMAVGTLSGTIPIGIALEKFGLRRTLTAGIILACLASVSRLFFTSLPAQIPLAVLSGIGLCTWGVCLSPAVASLTTRTQRPTAFSLMFSSGIGIAGLGALVAGNLPAYLQSIELSTLATAEKQALLLAALIAALSLILIARLKNQPVEPRVRLVPPSTPFLRRFLPAMAVWSLVTGAFPPFASVFFVHHLGLPLKTMGTIFSLSQLVQFAAILIAPFALRKAGSTPGIMLTQLTTALMLASLAQVHTAPMAAWCYWGYMAAQCMNEPGIYSLLMDRVPPADRSGASSYTFFVTAAAQIVASAAVGLFIVRLGYATVLWATSALAIVAALLFRNLTPAESPAPTPLPVLTD